MKFTVFIDVALLGSLHSEFKMFNHTTIFFLTNETDFFLFLAVLENSVFPMG